MQFVKALGAIALVVVLLVGCGDSDAPQPPPVTTPSAGAPPITASGDEVAYRAEQIGTYDRPVWVGSPPGDLRIFVVEQHTATIRVVGEDAPLLTLPEPVMAWANMIPYGPQILISTIGAILVIIIARIAGR